MGHWGGKFKVKAVKSLQLRFNPLPQPNAARLRLISVSASHGWRNRESKGWRATHKSRLLGLRAARSVASAKTLDIR